MTYPQVKGETEPESQELVKVFNGTVWHKDQPFELKLSPNLQFVITKNLSDRNAV